MQVCSRMRAREEVSREVLSLCMWWALWSLADRYTLDYSPFVELMVIGLCVGIVFRDRVEPCAVRAFGRCAPRTTAIPLSKVEEDLAARENGGE